MDKKVDISEIKSNSKNKERKISLTGNGLNISLNFNVNDTEKIKNTKSHLVRKKSVRYKKIKVNESLLDKSDSEEEDEE